MAAESFQIVITDKEPDLTAAHEFVSDPAFGAITSFCGIVRNNNEGCAVEAVTYDVHEPLAMKALRTLCLKAIEMADGQARIYIAHARGRQTVGEASVVIAVGTPHRKLSFELCQFLIDHLKEQAPIWKNEHYVEGGNAWLAGNPLEAAGK
jgi:molybdopterin synthase catalytic subunit